MFRIFLVPTPYLKIKLKFDEEGIFKVEVSEEGSPVSGGVIWEEDNCCLSCWF